MMSTVLKKLPYPIKQGLKYVYSAVPPRIRYGKAFWDIYSFLEKSQWWSKAELEAYQMQQLHKLLVSAYKNVPYYRRVFDERGLMPHDIQTLDDLRKLPYLTKTIIRENLADMLATNVSKSQLVFDTTGGSTGIPLGFYCPKDLYYQKEWAYMLHQWSRVGFRIGDKRVVLRGNIINSNDKNKFWEFNPLDNSLILSSYHISNDTIRSYIDKIKAFNPRFMHVYPSSATLLARHMIDNNISPLSNLQAVLCGSENLYPWQRSFLEKAFQCRIYSWYGHSEKAVLAGECEQSNYYHNFDEYGIVELLSPDGLLIRGEGESGKIVATSLNNFAMPFIRYKTEDIAERCDSACRCGRHYSLIKKVEGRSQDIIVTSDNRLITLTALIFAQHFDAFCNIKGMQLYQDTKGELVVRIIKAPSYSDTDEMEIRTKMAHAAIRGLSISFHYVDVVERTNIGKTKFLIQKISSIPDGSR